MLGRELHETRERFTDGTWMLSAFFEAFELPSDSAEEAFWKRGQAISRWKVRSPASILPALAEAKLYIDHAWNARGSEGAGSSESDRKAVFHERLTTARRLLERNPQAKSSPLYYDSMLIIGRGQGWPRAEYFRLFEEAVQREPDYYTHYFRTAGYLRNTANQAIGSDSPTSSGRSVAGKRGTHYTRASRGQSQSFTRATSSRRRRSRGKRWRRDSRC